MVYEIILGRSESDKLKYGKEGTIFLGRQYVKMGQVASLSNDIYLDVAKSHVVFVCGKRGSGKSYSLAVIAEGIAELPPEISQNIAVVILDTMGIYWAMKFSNKKDEQLLQEWGLKSKALNPLVYTPIGYYKKYKSMGIPTDFPFSIRPSELSAADWCLTFGISLNEPVGILIERIIEEELRQTQDFSMEDIIEAIHKYAGATKEARDAAENRFQVAKNWGLFSKDATPIESLVRGGQITILDISCYTVTPGAEGLRALAIGLISKKLFISRMTSRKLEEYNIVKKEMHYILEQESEEKLVEPIVWLMIDECLPYDAEIITDKAHASIGKVIERIEKGEKVNVWSYDTIAKDYGYFPVEKVYKKGKRKLIKLKTETGRDLVCTPNHRVLTKNGFIHAVLAENIGVPTVQHYDQNRNSIVARIFGHILGDGWLSINQTVGFSGKGNIPDLIKIKKDLEFLGFKSSSINSRITNSSITNNNRISFSVTGLSQSIYSSRKAFNFFRELKAPIGDKVIQKFEIPEWLLNGADKEKIEFLGALFGSDGQAPSVSKKVSSDFNPIRLSFNKSIALKKEGYIYGNQIIKLLNDLGVKAKISLRDGNIRKNGTITIKFVITIDKQKNNVIKFLEKIGYRYCERKEIEGNKWLAYLKYRNNLRNERVELRNRAIEMHNNENLGKTKIAKLLGMKEYEIREWIYFDREAWLPKLIQGFKEWIGERYHNKTIFELIVSKELGGEEDVFDIAVKYTHNFVSNGCVVHNCHEYLPEDSKTSATDALLTILREGRQPGISLILASQQPGKIHQDVMTQSDIVISHRLTAKLDVDALGTLMQSYMREGLDKQLNNLPAEQGAAIVFDDVNERIYPMRVRPRFTWHGGEAPIAIPIKKKVFDF